MSPAAASSAVTESRQPHRALTRGSDMSMGGHIKDRQRGIGAGFPEHEHTSRRLPAAAHGVKGLAVARHERSARRNQEQRPPVRPINGALDQSIATPARTVFVAVLFWLCLIAHSVRGGQPY